ncbi:retinol dehydrogenase 12-like [Watersipora subatra]|uniref:retinol dehydrogenase 12-like n=1 Tax=Watersipora subatra TaxID=2589382 RepID=UPI00355BD5A4
MTGRVVIVTGADRGIGYETARYMAAEGGYDVVLACRDQEKGQNAIHQIKKDNPSALVTLMQLDLSSLTSVRDFVTNFTMKKRKLHVLVNNAAVKLSSTDLTAKPTRDQIEVTMATNYIGPFLLTHLLLDLLVTAAHMTGDARIVNVTCAEHDHEKLPGVTELDVDNFQLTKKGTFSGLQAYKNSKLCNILFSYQLADSLSGTGVSVNCINPGNIPSTQLESRSSKVKRGLKLVCLHYLLRCAKFTQTKKQAGKQVALLASSDKYKGSTGCYYEDGVAERSSIESYDRELRQKVWNISKKIAGLGRDDGFDDISLHSTV